MATIGWLNIGLSVNTTALSKGLKKARKEVAEWASAGWEKIQVGALAIGAAGAALGVFTKFSMDAIDATNDMASKLGTTAGALAGLHYAAKLSGVEAESLDSALEKMTQNLGKAADAGSPAAKAFKDIGLDAQQLAGMDTAAAFEKIAGAIAKLPTPAAQAASAMEIFGKGGVGILGVLQQGEAGIKALTGEASQLGLALSQVDAEGVANANDALDRAGMAVAGIGTQLAVALSPYIEAAANQFTDFAKGGIDSAGFIATALDKLEQVIGFTANAAQSIGAGFKLAQSLASSAVAAVLRGIESLASAIESLIGEIPGLGKGFSATVGKMAADVEALAKDQWDAGKKAWEAPPASKGVADFFTDLKSRANDAAAAAAASKSALAALRPEGAKAAVALESAAKEQAKWEKTAAKLKEDIQTPLDKYQAKLKEIQELSARGLITKDEAARGLDLAAADLGKGQKDQTAGAAMELGSAEARRTVLSWSASGGPSGSSDPAKQTANATTSALAETQRQTPLLASMARYLSRLAGDVTTAAVEI